MKIVHLPKNSYFILSIIIWLILSFSIVLASESDSKSSDSDHSHQESEKSSHSNSEHDDDDSDDDNSSKKCGPSKGHENDDDSDDDDSEHKQKSSSDDDDKDGHHNKHDSDDDGDDGDDGDDCGNNFKKPLGTAHFIIDNTASSASEAVATNLATLTAPACKKTDALTHKRCNSFSLGSNNIQVIQNNANGNLVKMIGVNNENSTSYNKSESDTPLDNFSPDSGHYIDINSIRNGADKISLLDPSLPPGTYGNISFEQFIKNISVGQNMYGIVRVKIPLIKNGPNDNIPSQGNEKSDDGDDDDHHDENKSDDGDESHSSKTSIRFKSSNSSKYQSDNESSDDDSNDDGDHRNSRPKYRLCGEQPTPQCLLCGPGANTKIEAGETICGIPLNNNAKVNVFGSLMFDWIDCDSKEVVSLDDLRASGKNISFDLSVPLNINPANQDNSQNTMMNMNAITDFTGNNNCPEGSPCEIPLNETISFNFVSEESKNSYRYNTNRTLNSNEFSTLSQSQKFHLLLPSGYAQGWNQAFKKLNITASTWNLWGFKIPKEEIQLSDPILDENQILTESGIRSTHFQDIPALIYSGGLVGIHHHTNISGLIYVPHSFDLEQNGMTLNGNNFEPSLQYISGAIIVRDGFYFEAKYEGGATIISNDPSSYSATKLDPTQAPPPPRWPKPIDPIDPTNPNNPNNPDSPSDPTDPNSPTDPNDPNNPQNAGNPGTQWMEIRPQ